MIATSLLFDLIINSTITSIFISILAILQVYVVASTSSFEITISFNITIYDSSSIVQQRLQSIAKIFFNIWKNNDDTINVFEKNWMSIKIIFDIKSESSRVYFVDSQDRKFINQKFNKLQREKKINWIRDATSYDFFVFVVWKIVHALNKNSIKKNKVVIDIRDFNKMSKSNDYFMSLQSNIINFVNERSYVNVMNAIEFFHQWLIKIANRHKLIVVSHKDNEQFNVIIMKFRNNSTYVQRQIDIILRDFRDFVRVYVNDIVMFNKTLEKHIEHLIKIFELFRKMNIVLKLNNNISNTLSSFCLIKKLITLNSSSSRKNWKSSSSFDFLSRWNNWKRIWILSNECAITCHITLNCRIRCKFARL